jgi:rubrerythrin
MRVKFNIEEILEMAVQIEKNGASFYEKLAGVAKDERLRSELSGLAEMEKEHVLVFETMKKGLAGAKLVPGSVEAQYLQVIADGYVFNSDTKPEDILAQLPDLADVFGLAIALEKDSIAFYLGIKAALTEKESLDKLDLVIKEEMSHIVTLSDRLAQF